MNVCYTNEHGEIVHNERTCPACDAIDDLKAQLEEMTKELKEMTAERDALLEKGE